MIGAVKKYLPYLLSILAGWIAAFAMPPAGIWPCLILGFSLFAWLWQNAATYRAAFLIAFLFGIGYFTTGLWWIGNALLIEGNEFWWVWPISVIGLPVLLSLFTGFFSSLAKVFFKTPRLSTWIGFAAFLTVSEWVRGHIFTGFPWNLYGYAWGRHLEILQSVSLFGAFTLTLWTVMIASAPTYIWFLRGDKKRAVTIATLTISIFALLFGFGMWRMAHTQTALNPDVAVRIVQPNIPQTMKWDEALLVTNFEKHLLLSGKDSAPKPRSLFILWPETAIPPQLLNNQVVRQKIARMLRAQSPQTVLLTGALVHEINPDGSSRYFNSLLAFNDRAQVKASYSKTHLVPFGEFIPFQRWIPITPVVRFQGFEAGTGPQTLIVDAMPGISPLICYEIIFSGQVALKNDRPAALVAITNDGWYGKSAGPYQHFFQVQVRAMEEGLPAIRSANTGISGVIDPLGRVLTSAPIFETASLDLALPHPLPPTLFARTGTFFWFCALIGIIAACAIRHRVSPLAP